MGMRDDRQVRIGRNIAVAWTVAAYTGAVMIGLCALALFGPKAIGDAELVLPFALTALFPLAGGRPPRRRGRGHGVDRRKHIIVAGTAVSQDAYKGIIRRGQVSDRALLNVSRGTTLAIGVLSLVLALTTGSSTRSSATPGPASVARSRRRAAVVLLGPLLPAGVVTALLVGLLTTIVWIATGLDSRVTAMA